MNRRARRLLRSKADEAARQMAVACFDYTPTGGVVRVNDHRAVRVLERAFVAMLRRGCMPLAMPITVEEALSFPKREAPRTVSHDASPWLAVGIDGEGRGTYALRWLRVMAQEIAHERAVAEAAMLAELSIETARPGFPMGQAMGRA